MMLQRKYSVGLYRSITPANNMVLKEKWDRRQYDKHREKVRNAKPIIDNRPPASFFHLQVNLKKQQQIEERRNIIERDNNILLQKMCNITGRRASQSKYQAYRSQNKEQRRNDLIKVKKENHNILQRIQRTEPRYNYMQWLNEWRLQNQYMTNISKYPHSWIRDVNGGKDLKPITVA